MSFMSEEHNFEIIATKGLSVNKKEELARKLSVSLSVSLDYLNRQVAEENTVFFISKKGDKPIGFIIGAVGENWVHLALIKAFPSVSFFKAHKKTVGTFLNEKFQSYAKSNSLKISMSPRTPAGRKFFTRPSNQHLRRK